MCIDNAAPWLCTYPPESGMICLTLDLPFRCDLVELCYNYGVVEMWFSKQAKTFICSPFDKMGKIKIVKTFTKMFMIIFIFKNCHNKILCFHVDIAGHMHTLKKKKKERKGKTRSGLTSVDLEPNGCTQDEQSTL